MSLKPSMSLRALASGDMRELLSSWRQRGIDAEMPDIGMLRLHPSLPAQSRLLISVGVHGDETAPLEILAPLLDALLKTPQALAVDLLVVVGNPAALLAGKRFIDVDLNRLFDCFLEPGKSFEGTAIERSRADTIMRISKDFLSAVGVTSWHLDLHSTIRPSLHPCFAIIPVNGDKPQHQPLTTWLSKAGVDAIVYNNLPAATFSAFTARHCGASSCTVELGQVGELGTNDLTPFLPMQQAVECMMRDPSPAMVEGNVDSGRESAAQLSRYRVVREIIKRHHDFALKLPADACNFIAVPAGEVIAQEGQMQMCAGSKIEYALFPNPGVQPGQRAVLMLAAYEKDVS